MRPQGARVPEAVVVGAIVTAPVSSSSFLNQKCCLKIRNGLSSLLQLSSLLLRLLLLLLFVPTSDFLPSKLQIARDF